MIDSSAQEPQPMRPEQKAKLQALLWDEVWASQSDEGTAPWFRTVPLLDGWDQTDPLQRGIAIAFHRARTILQAISYGGGHWRSHMYLPSRIDSEAPFSSAHPGIKTATLALLDLVILSRVDVRPLKLAPQWSIPRPEDVLEVVNEVRRELGVEEECERLYKDDVFPVDFPGVGDTRLVDAILSGQVRVGNPEQPEVVSWRS